LHQLAIGRGFDPTGAGYFAGGFAGFITQSENVSFENMKMLLSMVLTLALLCRVGQKE
jgi:hypothetical protein